MEQYYFLALFFLVGYAIGKVSGLRSLIVVKKQNETLKKEALIMKNQIASTKKGRIIIQGEDKK
ncbi:hypothetical protein SDC9_131286 [bioreactor metagenome]|uniref:Uncharacterized protein n=1 Tax=bioreactor metagenome TaxID=1076179 RepID=A0A645D4T0_9ZZZZ